MTFRLTIPNLPGAVIAVVLALVLRLPAMGQNTEPVTGVVLDTKGHAPLSGASVVEKGTQNGVSCDAKGSFKLQVRSGATLVFSLVGYETKEVVVGDQRNLSVELQVSGSVQQADVIVIGYGTQRKKDLTGSIVNISSKDLNTAPVASFDQLLQGKIAGAQITQTSGAPGGNVNIVIRGVSSITGGNSPLYVIDGYVIGTGGGGADLTAFGANSYSSASQVANSATNRIDPLSQLNPADIESIQILKDASATAIYGSRGANGVVIITTKKGQNGKSVVSADISYGLQSLQRELKLLTPRQYAQFVADGRDNAWVLAGGHATDPNSIRSTATQVADEYRHPELLDPVGTDWQKVIFKTKPVSNYQVSVSGGTPNTKFYLSAGVLDQEGIVIGSRLKRFSLRSNVDAKLNSHFKIGTSIAGSYSYGDFARAEGHLQYRGLISAALAMSPTYPVRDSTGKPYTNFSAPTGLPVENPLNIAADFQDKRDFTNVFNNNYLEYEVIPGLVFRSTFGVTLSNRETRLWKNSQVGIATTQTGPATAAVTEIKSLNYLNENTLDLKRSFGQHDLDLLGGFSVQRNSDDYLEAGATSFTSDLVPYLAGGVVNAGTNYKSEYSIASWFGRVNYVFAQKYLLTATLRQDGSSRFGTANKWGTFPSVSLGYRLSEESFMKPLKFVSNLKLRASYGIAGNNQISDYASKGVVGTRATVRNGSLVNGIVPLTLANNDLTWEQSEQTNIGLDLGLFEDRITLTVDAYRSLKKNLLLNVNLPSISGFGGSTQNVGQLENKGLEFLLNTENIRSRDFQWTTSANISFNKNRVVSLNSGGARIANSDYQFTQVGLPISEFFLLHTTGVFKTQDEISHSPVQAPNVQPGDLKFEDYNKDGKITTADKRPMGSPWPGYTWGLDNRFTYKRLSLSVSLTASHGNMVYFNGGEINLNDAGVQNQLAVVADRWRSASEPGNGYVPRAIRNDYAFGISSTSRYLFDGSFVKIRYVNLSYSLPEVLSTKLRMRNMNAYLNVTNLHTFTKYPGYNPEGSIGGDNVAKSGIDYFAYPDPRTITLGIRASF